jgi:hypothetical protein
MGGSRYACIDSIHTLKGKYKPLIQKPPKARAFLKSDLFPPGENFNREEGKDAKDLQAFLGVLSNCAGQAEAPPAAAPGFPAPADGPDRGD